MPSSFTRKLPTSTLTIAGTPVEVTHENVRIEDLSLDPYNPRIRFQFQHGNRKPPEGPDELFKIVREQSGFDHLQKQIRKQKGIHDPLIVRHDGRVVEGNTRFAVICLLAKQAQQPQLWQSVPVMRLNKDVSEKTIQLLMADYHIAGKTTWRPAAQADQIYRLLEEERATEQEVADATRMTIKKVQQYVAAYRYLLDEVIPAVEAGNRVDRQEILEKKFSHALELTTRKGLQHIRDNPEARKKVAKLIATDKIQGAEVRKLPAVMANPKAQRVLADHGFKAANQELKKVDPTADSKTLKRMEDLTETLRAMPQKELELFKSQAKARSILLALQGAVDDIVDISRARPGKRDAR
jgi:hypothetical protein